MPQLSTYITIDVTKFECAGMLMVRRRPYRLKSSKAATARAGKRKTRHLDTIDKKYINTAP